MLLSLTPLHRFLCALLAVFFLIACCLVPSARAVVLADDLVAAGAVGIVAAIWIASGAEFASTDDLWKACQHVYDNYIAGVPELLSEVTQLARQWAWTWGGAVGKVGVLVSSRLWDAVCGSPSSVIGGSISSGVSYSFDSVSDFLTYYPSGSTPYYKRITVNDIAVSFGNPFQKVEDGVLYYKVPYTVSSSGNTETAYFNFTESEYKNPDSWYGLRVKADPDYNYIWLYREFYRGSGSISRGFSSSSFPATVALYDVLSIGGTIAEPQDIAVTLPQATPGYDDEGKIVYPDIPLDAPSYRTNTADIPTDAALPTDTVIDLTTGAEITDVTDTPIETTGTLDKILSAITGFFDSPSNFKLDFSGFQNIILPDRFPFCIPFDFADAIKTFGVAASDYKFEINLETSFFQVHHIVDLSPYAVPIGFFRYIAVAWFCIILILRTRDMMKW